jgi:Gamma-glutamyl cyclotransferase, AIG2-like
MPLLFSYGTLQRENVQLTTFGRRLSGMRDELVGYEPSLVPIADPELAAAAGMRHHVNAAFTGRPESRVCGTAFEVTAAEIALADTYEQRASYTRIHVTLASGRPAWVYVDARSAPRRS